MFKKRYFILSFLLLVNIAVCFAAPPDNGLNGNLIFLGADCMWAFAIFQFFGGAVLDRLGAGKVLPVAITLVTLMIAPTKAGSLLTIRAQIQRIGMMALPFIFLFIAQSAFAKKITPPPERANQAASSSATQNAFDVQAPSPPERADQMVSSKSFSIWDIQALYGNSFREPGISNVIKRTVTLENSSGWDWGSSYFFLDYLRSNQSDQNATEFYGEWYPSASIGKITCQYPRLSFLSDVLVTMGFNAGTKNTGASPLAFLPGLTFDLKIPMFQFFSLGTYAYIDKGRVGQFGNGCNTTTYQITPSWSLPFAIGQASFRFDGFVDYIGKHGQCAHQIVAQPTIKLDLGNFRGKPNRLFAGVEWSYWRNKYGITGLNQTAPQGVVMWVF